MPPDCGLMDKQISEVKGCKKWLTYALTANADGSEKPPAFIIGKATRPRAFKKKTRGQLGFYYQNNAKAWMTTVLYQEWISAWDEALCRRGQCIMLFQDNFSARIPPDLTNIHIENFTANLTSYIQLLDAGIICNFKAHYCKTFIMQAIGRYDNDIIPTSIYDINQLEAM